MRIKSSARSAHTLCAVYFLWIAWLMYCLYDSQWIRGFDTWEVSTWISNYQGGFVRRGLFGEGIYQLWCFMRFPVPVAVTVLYVASFVFFLTFIIRMFVKEGWSVVLLPTSLMFASFFVSFLWPVKDWLNLLITGLIFMCYRNARVRPGEAARWWLALYALSMIQLLMHEAAFFYTFPVLMLLDLVRTPGWQQSAIKEISMVMVRFTPVILTMACVTFCKGDPEIARQVWTSWSDAMTDYPLGTGEVGSGIAALGWETVDTFLKHFRLNWMKLFYGSIPSLPFTLLSFVMCYYLVTRFNTADLRLNRLRPVDGVKMSNFVTLQLLFLSPMFICISCDYGRLFPYWVISSLMAYHFLRELRQPGPLTALSVRCQEFISRFRILHSPYFYFALALIIPVSNIGGANFGTQIIVKTILRHIAIPLGLR